MAAKPSTDEGLKRLGGGRWQTRDGRFTIEPQSGTWAVVDGEQTDELGLPLVRGPFGSLTAAKAAIEGARTSAAPESPLSARAKSASAPTTKTSTKATARTKPSPAAKSPAKRPTAKRDAETREEAPAPPPEPAWLTDLAPDDRRQARRLIDALAAADAPDPEGIARRDVAGGVPAAAAYAVARAIAKLGPDATPARVARLLADGRDESLGVRWRLVDGDGRPIVLDLKR